jgi:hypothetical protein
MNPQFEVGTIQKVPFLAKTDSDPILSEKTEKAWASKRFPDTSNIISSVFISPALARRRSRLVEGVESWSTLLLEVSSALAEFQFQIDEISYRCFGIGDRDKLAIQKMFGVTSPSPLSEEGDDGDNAVESAARALVSELLDYNIGVAFGRWDIRYATGEQAAPELPDPFAPLPVCPPGQLQNAQDLPARPEDVPAAYPVRIPWDGILVDDPNHPLDLERRVREVIEIIWSGKESGPTAESIEHEACEILGVKSLRDYFRKPTGFFADHLKRYSKSRRQAPIYWPLSTASGSYTLWLYYHRLTPDTLYKCLQQFVEPKIKDVEQEIHHLRTMLTADEAGTKERKQLADAETLLNELKDLHAELSLWAPKWKPNLNDGVLITASPLWKLFRLLKWQKALETCWKELNKGDYDWAHLALTLRPNEVREKCKSDRSLAIAHSLEDLCEIKAPEPKKKRAAKKVTKSKAKGDLFTGEE